MRLTSRTLSACSPRARALVSAVAFGGVALAHTAAAAPAAVAPAVPFTGVPGTPHERTFIALKPDAVQRGLIGQIIQRFESKGYKLVGLKLLHPTKEMAQAHYADLAGRPFFPGLVDFFSSGPIVAMVWEGTDAIKGGRRMLGATNPADSAPGSIRGDFCIVTGRNIIHGSDVS